MLLVLFVLTVTMFQVPLAILLTIYSLFQFCFFNWFIVYSELLFSFDIRLIFDDFSFFTVTLNSQ